VERELILNPNGPLRFEGFNAYKPEKANTRLANDDPGSKKLDDVVASHIQNVLALTEGRIHGKEVAAYQLGVNPSTLRNMMNKPRIKYKKNRYRFFVKAWTINHIWPVLCLQIKATG
jgi:hypothetical protein